MSKLKKLEILDLLIEFSYLAIIFIIPLYFSFAFPTYNVFELSKTAIFRIIFWFIFLLTFSKIFFVGRARVDFKKYYLVPLVFIVGLGLTIFFSQNFAQSFFGSYDRQSGYISYLFYFFWFALLSYNLISLDNHYPQPQAAARFERRIQRAIIVAACSAFIVAIYGILQILGLDFIKWPEDPLLTKRTLSSFGQPNFLASWLLLVIPLSAYLIYKSERVIYKFFFSLVFFAQLVCLFFTASRGGMIALVMTGLLFILYIIFFLNIKRISKIFISSGLLLLLIIGAWGVNYLVPGRISSLLDFRGGSMAARVNFYQAASDAIIKKPIFGYGVENSGEVFINYYQPDWGIYGDIGATTDKAHNLVLDIILATGFLGLLFFILIYYFYFALVKENIQQRKMRELSIALALGVAAYLFSLLFSFSIVAGEIYFWFFLALLVAINIGVSRATIATNDSVLKYFNRNQSLKVIAWLLTGVVAMLGVVYEFKTLISDHYFNKLYYYLGQEEYLPAFVLAEYMSEGVTNPVNKTYYNRFLGDKLSEFYPQIIDPATRKITHAVLVKTDKKLVARGYENIYAKAKINSALENYSLAEEYYKQVLRQTPYWPKTYLDYAQMLVREKKIYEAIAVYKMAETNLPDAGDSRFNEQHLSVLRLYQKVIYRELGNIYFSLGNYEVARINYEKAYRANINDYSLLKKISDTYYLGGNLRKSLEYSERGALRNPFDYNWFLSSAILNHELGDTEAARENLDEALRLAPTEKKLLDLKAKY